MITTKIYEDKSGDLVAVVIEDEQVSNYIPCPEIAVFDGEGFFEEARNGFWMRRCTNTTVLSELRRSRRQSARKRNTP